MSKLVHPKVYELAHFLMRNRLLPTSEGTKTKPTGEDIQEFAEHIQQSVDDYLHEDEIEGEGEYEPE